MIPASRQKGSALLSVLWITVVLGFVGMALAANVRSEVESTRLLAESEQGYFLARAGIEAGLLRLTTPPADPRQAEAEMTFRAYDFQFQTGAVHIDYVPASALYNVNVAPPGMLFALLQELGAPDAQARAIVEQLNQYRHPNKQRDAAALESIDELLTLPAMTPELFYGSFVAGRRRPGVEDVLGVYGAGETVNVNYAHMELLAVLPGMSEAWARQFVALRPFRQLDARKTPPSVSLGDSNAFALIAHGRANIGGVPSDIERAIRADYVRDQKSPRGLRLINWHEVN